MRRDRVGQRSEALRLRLFAAATCALLLAACSVDRGKNPSFGCDGCTGSCVMGFCLQDEGSALRDDDAGSGVVTDDAGAVAAECDEPGEEDFCYEGPSGTSTMGRCKAGTHVCIDGQWSACLGQVTPREETCNGDDDDCDGETDEEVTLGSCETGLHGLCGSGVLSCEGAIAFCVGTADPVAEACDGDDNDCDNNTDEGTEGVCFPSEAVGCTELPDGSYECLGVCAPGTRRCNDGVPELCEDFVGPQAEACGGGGTAADEDCDGEIDEGCTCTGDQTQSCYSGPADTEGRGECEPGTQSCVGSRFGECVGQTMPTAESCANEGADNNCDGTDDNIVGRGEPCMVPPALLGTGICRDGVLGCQDGGSSLSCVPRASTTEVCNGINDDCDNSIDEDFDLPNNPLNCGMCGRECGDKQSCCQGQCINVESDPLNCGECGNDCGLGRSCCGSRCVDLKTDIGNCGVCGRRCDGAVTCCVDAMCSSDEIGNCLFLPGG